MTRLARALNSDDLSHEEGPCDTDVLQATGTVSIYRGLGVLILEAKEGAAGEGAHAVARIKDLERALGARIKRMAQRWRLRVDVDGVASQIARELILDRCLHCQGRGFTPMSYTSSDEIFDEVNMTCEPCHGSGAGRNDYHARYKAAGFNEYTRQLGDWWEAVIQSCCDAENSARSYVWRKLKG
jgi:hypothetical protein